MNNNGSSPDRRLSSSLAAPILLLLISAGIGRSAAQVPAGIETIFIVPGSHLDVGFTDTPSRVRDERIRSIENAVRAAERDPEFRWFEEGGWSLNAWLQQHGRDERRMARVRTLFRTGQFGVGASWVNPHAAAFPEAMGLLTLHVGDLDHRFGYRPSVAVLNDPPSYPEALADVFAAAGIRYLLVGANMFVSRPLPANLVRTPFWWETAHGNRILVYIDSDSYTAGFANWGLGPRCARLMNPKRFPTGRSDIETMEDGILTELRLMQNRYDAVIVQQAFDNWGIDCAVELPDAVKRWNNSGKTPKLVIAEPQTYFRHIEERYGATLPVYRGEWGGQWDDIRAISPVWTWRLREAARALSATASLEARVALATALDHNLAGGAGHPDNERKCRAHSQETAEIFGRAVALILGSDQRNAVPTTPPLDSPVPPPSFSKALVSGRSVRFRTGPLGIAPFVNADAPEIDASVSVGSRLGRLAVRASVDRRKVADAFKIVIEVPIRGNRKGFRLAPEGSDDAIANRWLAGEPPFVIAPHGVRVIGSEFSVSIVSPLILAWTLEPDLNDSQVTWLQGLVAWQATACDDHGKKKPLPFETLNPGEPAILPVQVEIALQD